MTARSAFNYGLGLVIGLALGVFILFALGISVR